jgi:hypothetical protein
MCPVATGFGEAHCGLTVAFSGTKVLSGVMWPLSVAHKQQHKV